jgi:hypothetical protein
VDFLLIVILVEHGLEVALLVKVVHLDLPVRVWKEREVLLVVRVSALAVVTQFVRPLREPVLM